MSLLASLIFSAVASAAPMTDQPLPQKFDANVWREIYLEIANEPDAPRTEIVNPPAPGTPQAAFIDFFQKVVEPKGEEIGRLQRRYYGLRLLLDSGLARDKKEYEAWSQELQDLIGKLGALDADPEYKEMVLRFGKLAEGLTGSLAEEARRAAHRVELTTFPPEMQSKLVEMYQLDAGVDQIAAELPAKDRAIEAEQELGALVNAFHKGQIPFAEAAKKLEALSLESSSVPGQQLVDRAGANLQKIAILRSELAKSKKFPNWAQYAIVTQAEAHAEGLKSADQLLKFLYQLLDETDSVSHRVFEVGAQKFGVKYESLRPSAMYLLLPPADYHLYGYFPRENIERVCRDTMTQSGFPESLTCRVMVDAFPRPGKQGHAYMMPARMSSIRHPKVDGTSLNILVPDPDGPEWTLPITSIVQNFSDDDLENVRTMFHENGHGLDYASQRLELSFPSSYGYAETHSTTMEHFLQDREFLLNNARDKDGKAAPAELVDKYLHEKSIANLMNFRATVVQAIFDIELWNYDYSTQQATTVWDRAIELNARLRKRSRFVDLPADLVRPLGFGYFRTNHFYGGSVTYFGYVLAQVSAGIVHQHLLDELAAKTGRRSLYRQPELASLLLPLYRNGPREKFPTNVEHFTGKTFSARDFARGLVKAAEEALASDGPSCSTLLANDTLPPWHSRR